MVGRRRFGAMSGNLKVGSEGPSTEASHSAHFSKASDTRQARNLLKDHTIATAMEKNKPVRKVAKFLSVRLMKHRGPLLPRNSLMVVTHRLVISAIEGGSSATARRHGAPTVSYTTRSALARSLLENGSPKRGHRASGSRPLSPG